jgi:predicted NAD/FAD-dependent oxidoreductase
MFDWTLLVPSNGGAGEARFDTQYWRANVDPSERYTLALPGTREARIMAGGTGIENLFVCGDWIDNGFYIGAAEGAVISGMQAFRAVTGKPLPIAGEAFWYR